MDQKVLNKVLERCENGEAIMNLCREYGLKRHTLYAYCKRNGIQLKSKYIYQPFKCDVRTRKRIAYEYKNGKTSTEIAKKYGVSHKSVIGYLYEFGMKVRSIEDNRKIHGIPIINLLVNCYKRSEAAKRYGFKLTYHDVENIIFRDCFYCGTKPDQSRRSYPERYNGIDRIDSTKGYEIDNCVTACFRCNSAKNNMTTTQFGIWVKRLIENDIFNKLLELNKIGDCHRIRHK